MFCVPHILGQKVRITCQNVNIVSIHMKTMEKKSCLLNGPQDINFRKSIFQKIEQIPENSHFLRRKETTHPNPPLIQFFWSSCCPASSNGVFHRLSFLRSRRNPLHLGFHHFPDSLTAPISNAANKALCQQKHSRASVLTSSPLLQHHDAFSLLPHMLEPPGTSGPQVSVPLPSYPSSSQKCY